MAQAAIVVGAIFGIVSFFEARSQNRKIIKEARKTAKINFRRLDDQITTARVNTSFNINETAMQSTRAIGGTSIALRSRGDGQSSIRAISLMHGAMTLNTEALKADLRQTVKRAQEQKEDIGKGLAQRVEQVTTKPVGALIKGFIAGAGAAQSAQGALAAINQVESLNATQAGIGVSQTTSQNIQRATQASSNRLLFSRLEQMQATERRATAALEQHIRFEQSIQGFDFNSVDF